MILLVISAFLVLSSCEALTSSGASLDRLAKISNKYFDWYPAILLFHSLEKQQTVPTNVTCVLENFLSVSRSDPEWKLYHYILL